MQQHETHRGYQESEVRITDTLPYSFVHSIHSEHVLLSHLKSNRLKSITRAVFLGDIEYFK